MLIPFPEPDRKILGREGGWETVRVSGGWADGGSEDREGFEGEEDLGGRGWESVDVVLWVWVVDSVREDFWGALEDDIMIFLGTDNAGEGSLGVNEVRPVSGELGGLKGSLEGVFEG